MAYKDATQFDRAAKKAIRGSGREAGNAYREMLRDRFLCRVFAGGGERFVLKGGSGLLARIPDARKTRDLDLAARRPERESAEEVLADIEGLVSADLGDFVTFRLTKHEESLDENGYSRLLKLRYATFVGDEEKDPVLIDLSLDCELTCPPERITPANRVDIEGVGVSDYLAYPLPDQLADKLCAIMELQPGGWQSSRMKDLADVVIYATHEDFRLSPLRRAITSECAKRGMNVPEGFAAPEDWRVRFPAFARRNGLGREFADFEAATGLASRFFGPALAGEPEEATWNHALLSWS